MDDLEHRRFDPGEQLIYSRLPYENLVTYNREKEILQLRRVTSQHRIVVEHDTLVVYIDGAWRNKGYRNAQAAFGVYFGPQSDYNMWGRLSPELPQTSTRAEIEALAHALDRINGICEQDTSLNQIKIATDSGFLVDAMSKWIEDWIENGGRRSNGKPVQHFDALVDLHDNMNYMQSSDGGGIVCQLWHVGRERNQEADCLANRALDEA
jgi:ribonuclease HI